MKKEVGSIWKEDGVWKVQAPRGIYGCPTKKVAIACVAASIT